MSDTRDLRGTKMACIREVSDTRDLRGTKKACIREVTLEVLRCLVLER